MALVLPKRYWKILRHVLFIEIGDDMLELCSGYVYGRQLTIVLQETVNFITE
jgi:hypothetical protein